MPDTSGGQFVNPNYATQTGTAFPVGLANCLMDLKRLGNSFNPYAQATPNMTISVDAGHIFNGTTLTEVAAQATPTFTAPVSNPRIDRVVIDRASGTLSVVAGTENISPTPPAIPAGKQPVAQVYLTVGMAAIGNTSITDERDLGALGLSSGAFTTAGTAATANTGSSSGNVPEFDANGGLPGLSNLEANVQLTGVISPASLSASQNNFNPTGLSTASRLRLTASAPINITGIAAQPDGTQLRVENVGGSTITLTANDSSSSAANRFLMATGVALAQNQTVTFEYDGTLGGWLQVASPSSGGAAPTLLNTLTASNSASLIDTTSLTSTYRSYEIRFINCVPSAAGAVLGVRLSTNGGTSYDSAANYYTSSISSVGSGAFVNSAQTYISVGTTNGTYGQPSTTASAGGASGKITLMAPSNTTMNKHFIEESIVATSTTVANSERAAGMYMNTSAVNALKILFSTGNIASGTVEIWGIP